MSVRLMSLVFNCHMPELQTDKGKTVPDSTAKFILLALADNANDEGEGSYPGVDTLCRKTGFSTATVCNALNALRHNGFTQLVGRSKYDTNNYTILAAKIAEFQPLKTQDFSHYNPTVLAAKTNPSVKPLNNNKEQKNIFKIYEQNIGALVPMIADELAEAEKTYPADWIEPAFQEAVKANARKWQYVKKVLDNWSRNGYGWHPGQQQTKAPSTRPAYTPPADVKW